MPGYIWENTSRNAMRPAPVGSPTNGFYQEVLVAWKQECSVAPSVVRVGSAMGLDVVCACICGPVAATPTRLGDRRRRVAEDSLSAHPEPTESATAVTRVTDGPGADHAKRGPLSGRGTLHPEAVTGPPHWSGPYPNLAAALQLLCQSRQLATCLDHRVARVQGVRMSEAEILVRVAAARGGSATMSELARGSGFTQSGLSRIIDRLETRALVACHSAPADRRRTLVRPTATGLNLARELLELMEVASADGMTGDIQPRGRLPGARRES